MSKKYAGRKKSLGDDDKILLGETGYGFLSGVVVDVAVEGHIGLVEPKSKSRIIGNTGVSTFREICTFTTNLKIKTVKSIRRPNSHPFVVIYLARVNIRYIKYEN